MECKIDPKLPYTDLSTMIRRQRQARCLLLDHCSFKYVVRLIYLFIFLLFMELLMAEV